MPPLKPKPQRRNRTPPARGEWVDLRPLSKPILPPFRKGMTVSRALWEAWRKDPVTSQYGPADVAYVIELGLVYARLRENEVRLRMDSLGLTPKGKRDLRWRTPAEVATLAEIPEVRRLRVVGPPPFQT